MSGGLRIEVYENAGSTKLGTGPVLSARRAWATRLVDRVGRFEIELPGEEPQYDLFTAGREVYIYEDGAGLRYQGIIESRTWRVLEDGHGELVIGGGSLAVELEWESTYMGIEVDDLSVANALTELLTNTSWTSKSSGVTSGVDLTNRYDNQTVWAALLHLAQVQDAYIRETSTAREIEISQTTTDSGIVLTNYGIEQASPEALLEANTGLIEGLPLIREEGHAIINRVVPIGLKEQSALYDLRLSNRSSPYTISSFNGPPKPRVRRTALSIGLANGRSMLIDGVNTYLLVFFHKTHASGSGITIDTLRINGAEGEDLTLVDRAYGDTDTWECWGIAAPSNGILNGYWGKFSNGFVFTDGLEFSVLLENVDVVSPTHASADDLDETTTDDNPTVAVGTTSDGLVVAAYRSESNSDSTPGVGMTELVSSGADFLNDGAVATAAGTGSNVTMEWTLDDGNDDWYIVSVCVKRHKTYYLEDSTSVTAYGRRVKVLAVPEQRLLSRLQTGQDAANTLYDLGATYLERNKDPVTFYTVTVARLPNTDWLPGDSMRLLYRGRARDESGSYVWLDVDATVKVMSAKEIWEEAGTKRWELLLSTVYRFPRTAEEVLGEYLRDIPSLDVA